MDLRKRIFGARESGETTAEVAERYSVSTSFFRRLMQRYREQAPWAPLLRERNGAGNLRSWSRIWNGCATLFSETPHMNPREYGEELGFDVQPLTVWRAIRRLGLTFKKSRYFSQSNKGRMSKKPGKSGMKR